MRQRLDGERWLSRRALFCWLRAVAQLGSALALGARGRRFESGQPDHRNVSNRAPCIERVFGHTFPLRWTYGDPGASFGKSEPVGRATTARKGRAGTFTPTSRTLLWRDLQRDPCTKRNAVVLVEEHVYIDWVRAFHDPAAEFVLALHLHEGNDERYAQTYWRRALDLPDAEFHKTFIKPAGTGHRKNTLRHGVCRVVVRRSTDAWLRTMGWIEAISNEPPYR